MRNCCFLKVGGASYSIKPVIKDSIKPISPANVRAKLIR